MPFFTSQYLIHGYTFVSVFLVLAGYFAAVSIKKKYSTEDGACLIIRNELINRAFRLLPLMWIWILVYFFIGWSTIFVGGGYGDWARWYNEIKYALLGVYNYYLARLEIGGLFGQYWTLFVEIHFALVIIVLFAFVKSNKKRQMLSWCVIALCVFILRPLTPPGLVRYVTHAHLDSLFIGVELGLIDDNRKLLENVRISKICRAIVSSFLCAILLIAGWFFDTYFNNMNVKYAFFTILSLIIVALAREEMGWFNYGRVINRLLEWIGNVSASTYVSHIIVYSCVYYNIYSNTNIIPVLIKTTWWGVCIQVLFLELLAVFIGWISYNLIEKPYIAYGKSLISRMGKY